MKIAEKFTNFWNREKDKPLFKGKVLAVIMLIAALVVNFTVGSNGDTTEKDNSNSNTSISEEKEPPKYELHIGTSNIIALGICITALAAVKIKREKDLNGRHDKTEKNKRED